MPRDTKKILHGLGQSNPIIVDRYFESLNIPEARKQVKINDLTMERVFQEIAVLMEMFLIVFCVCLVQIMKVEFEKKESEKRYQLLSYIGIYRKDYKTMIKREIRQAFGQPLLWAYIVAVVIAGLTCYLREIRGSQLGRFVFCLAGIS